MSSHVALKTVWILIRWLLKKPAELDLHCLKESWYLHGFILFGKWKLFNHRKVSANLYYRTSKFFFGQVHYGQLLVLGQVENYTISTPLPYDTMFWTIHLLFWTKFRLGIFRLKIGKKTIVLGGPKFGWLRALIEKPCWHLKGPSSFLASNIPADMSDKWRFPYFDGSN